MSAVTEMAQQHNAPQRSLQDAQLDAPQTPVTLAWKNVIVRADSKPQPLLDNVAGKVQGGLTAIMGPSGSGKTTLLNTLACRLDGHTTVTGDMRLNGNVYSKNELKRLSGYVLQDDLVNGDLTVEETLLYTAQLRLSPSVTMDEKKRIVTNIMAQMGLSHIRKTEIGSALKRGVSGGERKRVCVAMELLTDPKLLFLDEPTSGQDAVAALSLCNTLREIAATRKCTILCTIHQPQAKIFALFNKIVILNRGTDLFQGPPDAAINYFAAKGFPVPALTNPADHIMDVITPPLNESRDANMENVKRLKDGYEVENVDMEVGIKEELPFSRDPLPWFKQFTILLGRCAKDAWRKKFTAVTQVIQTIVIAILIATVFMDVGNTQALASKRQALMFFCVINQGMFGALSVINAFPSERVLVLRERAAGTYFASAYFMAKSTVDLLVQLSCPIIFSCIVYWKVGFQATTTKFLIFTLFMILCSLAANSMALMISALTRDTNSAVTVLPMLLEVSRLFGGFFLPPVDLPSYFSWLDALSYVKYSYIGIAENELRGLKLRCPSKPNTPCPDATGEMTIKRLGLDVFTVHQCILILVAYIAVCRVIAYLGIRYVKW